MASESGLSVYKISFNGNDGGSVTIQSLVTSSATVTDYNANGGTSGDDLTVLGDDNQSSYSRGNGGDKFHVSYLHHSNVEYAYYGVATIDGVTGFIAAAYPESGGSIQYYFFAASSDLTKGESGTAHYDTGGSDTTDQWNLLTGGLITPGGSTGGICFCAGTMIATPSGEVAVETLQPGDEVLTSEGRGRAVRWLGRQTVSRLFADPMAVHPIRVRAGALGGGLPRRDLRVSPRHALLVDGVLIQAGALVNGVSILREAKIPGIFVYYHVELGTHELILAEGTPAETFIDNADREAFDNWAEHQALCGEGVELVEMDLPRALSARQVPAATRQRLAALALALQGGAQEAA